MNSSNFEWSLRQQALFTAVEDPKAGSLRVESVAGSGKTTSLVEAIERVPANSVLAIAFNKKTATELQERIHNPKASAMTFNSLGHRAWAKYLGGRKLTLSTNKLFGILSEVYDGEAFSDILALTRAARNIGLVPEGSPGIHTALTEDTKEIWEDLAETKDIEPAPDTLFWAKQLLIESIKASFDGTIDFDDQVYMTACWSAPCIKYEAIFVDEAQDLNALQHVIVRKSLALKGRVIAFGDSHQAIYGFRGALSDSMEILHKMFRMTEFPLDISYRCPQKIVRHVQNLVPHIQAHKNAPEGTITRDKDWNPLSLEKHSAVLCRNNGPLFKLAFRLIQEGRSVKFLGRDLAAGLHTTIKKITHNKNLEIGAFISAMEDWAESEVARKPRSEHIIRDKVYSLKCLIHPHIENTKQLDQWIDDLLGRENGEITLSSVHRAKGLEWNHVYILDSWRMPSKYATQDWELQQEDNIIYVARTRAKRHLTYINLEERGDGERTKN